MGSCSKACAIPRILLDFCILRTLTWVQEMCASGKDLHFIIINSKVGKFIKKKKTKTKQKLQSMTPARSYCPTTVRGGGV